MTVGRPMGAPEDATCQKLTCLPSSRGSRLANAWHRQVSAAQPICASLLPCGTVKPRTCRPPPLDGLGASLDRDVLQADVSLDTRHLPMPSPARRRPENEHCCPLSDPRVHKTSSEEKTFTRAFDGSSRPPSLRHKQACGPTASWRGSRTVAVACSVRSAWSCRPPASSHHTVKPASRCRVARFPVRPEGRLPTGRWEMMSARLRGLHPSTSPLRHTSVRRTCRALLPWVSLSRSPGASRRRQTSQPVSHPAPATDSPTRRPDHRQTRRLCGRRR